MNVLKNRIEVVKQMNKIQLQNTMLFKAFLKIGTA